jgi:nucleotide-binding universal stress UspA family protein
MTFQNIEYYSTTLQSINKIIEIDKISLPFVAEFLKVVLTTLTFYIRVFTPGGDQAMTAPWAISQPGMLLVCTDGSAASQGAVDAAFILAPRGSIRLRVLQVLEYNPGFASQALDSLPAWEQEVREGLQKIIARARASGLEADMVVPQGERADQAILAEAEASQPDLILTGRHGRTGLAEILMGSVTARLIGYSPVNVLVVPRQGPLTFQRLLVASDGSPFSDAAWREALVLARSWSSRLLAVSVAPKEGEVPEVREILAKLHREAERAGIPATALLLRGAPDEAIIQAAQDHGADLLILGSHGRTGLKRLLMGSVTEQVIGKAPCPVLVVKRPLEKENGD